MVEYIIISLHVNEPGNNLLELYKYCLDKFLNVFRCKQGYLFLWTRWWSCRCCYLFVFVNQMLLFFVFVNQMLLFVCFCEPDVVIFCFCEPDVVICLVFVNQMLLFFVFVNQMLLFVCFCEPDVVIFCFWEPDVVICLFLWTRCCYLLVFVNQMLFVCFCETDDAICLFLWTRWCSCWCCWRRRPLIGRRVSRRSAVLQAEDSRGRQPRNQPNWKYSPSNTVLYTTNVSHSK